MEVAGLALGAIGLLPVAKAMIDSYKQGIAQVSSAWNIVSLLDGYENDIMMAESHCALATVELLTGVVGEDELHKVKEDPYTVNWEEDYIKERLVERMGETQFNVLMFKMDAMRKTLATVQSKFEYLAKHPVSFTQSEGEL